MLSEGKITADDAERLLAKLDELDDLEEPQAATGSATGTDARQATSAAASASNAAPGTADHRDRQDWAAWADWANSGAPANAAGGALGGFIAKIIKSSLGSVGVAMHTQSRSERVPHQTACGLRIRAHNGAVNVTRTGLTDVEIRADIRACSPERQAAVKIVAARDAKGTLEIRADWPEGGPRMTEACAFTVAIPDAVGIDIETTNGSISVEGLGGEGVLRTRNGSVDVRRHDGNLRADTTNGKIRLVDIAGNVIAHGSNGRISVERCSGSAELETTNGGIDLSQTPEGIAPVLLATTNGGITAELGRPFRGSLRLRTVNGHVSFNEPAGLRVVSRSRTSADLELGGNAIQSSLKTTNGSVQVTLAAVEEKVSV